MSTAGVYKIGGSSGSWVDITYAQLIVDPRWTVLDPEFARRVLGLLNLANAYNKRAYIGSTYRNDSTQRTEFLNRYQGVSAPDSTTITWQGVGNDGRTYNYWKKKSPDLATIAPPGKSYHGLVTKQQKCLGIDLMGYESDRTFLREAAPNFGLWMQTDPTDPHHFQPIEVPKAKVHYDPNKHTLSYFTFNYSSFSTPGGIAVFPKAPLYYGSTNPAAEVYKLQSVMKYWGWYTGIMRGDYDQSTYTAVKKMQAFLKVPVSGTYNSATDAAYRNFYFNQRIL